MPSKEPPNLLKRLEEMMVASEGTDFRKPQNTLQDCTLKTEKTCCQEKGYILEGRGMFARAKLCPCLEKCKACLGRLFRIEDGVAKPCQTPNPKFIAHLFNEARIPSRYTEANLIDFNNETGNSKAVIELIKEWENRFHTKPNEQKGLVIYGSVGVGKTFILAALARNFIFRGISVKFVDFFQLVTQIKASYTLNESEQKIMKPLMQVDILIIDELGKGRNNEFELTILDQIIMGRYNQNKILIASTNYPIYLTPEEIAERKQASQRNFEDDDSSMPGNRGAFSEKNFSLLESRMDQRIMSRLKETAEFLSFDLEAEDYRTQSKPKR